MNLVSYLFSQAKPRACVLNLFTHIYNSFLYPMRMCIQPKIHMETLAHKFSMNNIPYKNLTINAKWAQSFIDIIHLQLG